MPDSGSGLTAEFIAEFIAEFVAAEPGVVVVQHNSAAPTLPQQSADCPGRGPLVLPAALGAATRGFVGFRSFSFP